MAKPAFIYAFDNLGPYRFTELCGELLGSRYRGFLLGGVGPDGGVDGEIDLVLGERRPDTRSPLISELIEPGQLVVFQFKHKVTARVGQARARKDLLSLFKCTPNGICELHRNLIKARNPSAYVLITNVEVNSVFRGDFVEQCEAENPAIEHYQILGLDELESWVTMEPDLRHLYFPTIFGLPRYNLRIEVMPVTQVWVEKSDSQKTEAMRVQGALQIDVLNIGVATSYLNSIDFTCIADGKLLTHYTITGNSEIDERNVKPGTPIEPGRRQQYCVPLWRFYLEGEGFEQVVPVEILVHDEIGNVHRAQIPVELLDDYR